MDSSSDLVSTGMIVVILVVVGLTVMSYMGMINCGSAVPSRDESELSSGTRTRTEFGHAVSMAPEETSPANQQFQFSSTPETPLPTNQPSPTMELHPVPNNKVVLLSTLDPFPWSQMPPNLTKIFIDIEANIGPQQSNNFLVVSSGNGLFSVYSKMDEITLSFGGVVMNLGEFHFESPQVPLGTFTLHAEIEFHDDSMSIKADAQSGDIQKQKGDMVMEMAGCWGDDVRNKFDKADSKMFQGVNVNALSTTIKWETINIAEIAKNIEIQ